MRRSGVTDVVHLLDAMGHGGDALAALSLAAAQHTRGLSVAMLIVRSEQSAGFVDRARARGVEASELAELRHDGAGISGWRRTRSLTRTLRAYRPRVVHVHSGGLLVRATDALAVRLSGAQRRIATVQSPFDWNSYPGAADDQRRWRRSSRAFHAVTAPSAGALALQARARLSARRLVVVPNPVELADTSVDRQAARRALGVADDDYIVLYLARLVAEKGLLEVIAGFAEVARHDLSLRLVVAGSGELADAAVEAARTAGVEERVTMLGYRTDTAELRAAADVFVHPSHAESFGNSVVEAMNAGLPVVTTRVGVAAGFDEAEPPVVFVAPGCSAAIAGALAAIRSDSHSAAELGRRARLAGARYGPSAVADEFDQIYRGGRSP